MIAKAILGPVLAAATLLASAAAGQTPRDDAAPKVSVRLTPTGPWNANYGDETCRLNRVFEHKGREHALIIEQDTPGVVASLVLAGPEFSRLRERKPLQVGLVADHEPRDYTHPKRGELAGFGTAVLMPSVVFAPPGPVPGLYQSGIAPNFASKIETMVLSDGERAVTLETGNMGAVIEVLNHCTRDLLSSWGLDPAQHEAYVPARFSDQTAIAQKIQQRYPATALLLREESIIRMRMIVEPDGTPSACKLLNLTAQNSLKSGACDIAMTGRFEPARSASGTPIRSFYSVVIRYQIGS